jgi:hypothetical protein
LIYFGFSILERLFMSSWLEFYCNSFMAYIVFLFFFTIANSTHFINQNFLNTKRNQLKETTTKLRIGRLSWSVSNHIRLPFNQLHLKVGIKSYITLILELNMIKPLLPLCWASHGMWWNLQEWTALCNHGQISPALLHPFHYRS